MRFIRGLLALAMVATMFSLTACGDSGSSSSGINNDGDSGTLSSVTQGVAVDPYIVGATFFEDVNHNGVRDTGEQISSPSDESGLFSFDQPVAIGSTLVMQDTGQHQGFPFTLILKRTIRSDDEGPVVVSPITTMLTSDISEDDLYDLLAAAGMPWVDQIQTAQFYDNPMAGLTDRLAGDATDEDIALLRTNFVAYAVMEFINRFAVANPTLDNLDTALGTEGFSQLLFDTLELICSAAMLEEVNGEIPAAGYPAMSLADLAETIPAVFYYWTGEFYSDLVAGREYFPTIAEIEDELKDIVLRLTPYTYALNHRDDSTVDPAELDLPPLDSDFYMVISGGRVSEVRPIDQEIVLDAELFENVAFAMADEILHFDAEGDADGTWETFSMDDDLVERSGGTWSVDGDQLLITDTAEDEELALTFIGEWPTYLRFMTTDSIMDGQPPGVVNLPLAKVRNIDTKDFEGQIFIVEDGDCSFDSDFCGGRVEFGPYDDTAQAGTATLHIYDEGSTESVDASWWIADNNALTVEMETADEINELYFLPTGSENERDALIVTKNSFGTVIDVEEEALFPVDNSLSEMTAGTFNVDSSSGEEITLYDSHLFTWTDGIEEEHGLWEYDDSSGELTLSIDRSVAVRLWFYNIDGPEATEYPFYYEDYEGGMPVESGFDQLELQGDAPVNVALNESLTPITNTVDGLPTNVVDGLGGVGGTGTDWYSYQGASSTCQFTLDLGQIETIGTIYLEMLQTDTFTVESSLNGSDWTELHQESGLWDVGFDKFLIQDPPIEARYFRYTGTNNETAWVGLREFQLYAP